MGIQNLSAIVSQKREVPGQLDLFPSVGTLPQSWYKKVSLRKLFKGRRKNYALLAKISIFAKNDYNPAENTKFLARSIFNISTNSDPLITTDGALEL